MTGAHHHIAEFNIGTLRHDWDDPRVADFAEALDRVNAIAQRSPGFVWMMDEDAMDAAQKDAGGMLGGNPRTASTLSVWESAEDLRAFAFDTVHRAFYERGAEWFEEQSTPRLVMWHVAPGHRPTIAEAAERLAHLTEHGPSACAFGWNLAGVEAKRCGEAA